MRRSVAGATQVRRLGHVGLLPSGRLAFVFTDVVGSTALLRSLGDHAFDELIRRCRDIVRQAAVPLGGMEVGTEGDGMFLVFTDAAGALQACVGAQVALRAADWGDAVPAVRIGLHVGEGTAVADGTDYVGLGVHQAARVANAANGDQVLLSDAAVTAIAGRWPGGVGAIDLGLYALRDFDAPERLWEARHPDLPGQVAPPRAASAVVHNLPPVRTTFVGRQRELDDLAKRITSAALVTVVGPGGVGKTRLATEAGRAAAGHFADGVWLVSLDTTVAPGADAGAVASAAAAALHRPLTGTASAVEALVRAVGERRLLMIVDNCEHVLDGAAEMVDALVLGAPNAAVLATSREPLDLVTEWVVRLDPLPVPDEVRPGRPLDIEAVRACDAVALFANRAAQSSAGFNVDGETAGAVATLCRRLDGVPLALELAAARVGRVNAASLLTDLEASIATLRRRGGDERHRTLDAAVDWSYRLLDRPDQLLLARLSVFRAPVTADTVRAVCGDDEVPPVEIDERLRRLADRSLCEVAHDDDPPRYRVLESIRRFGADRLNEEPTGTAEHTRRSLLAWARTEIDREFVRLGTPATADAMAALRAEHANLLAALDWAIDAPDQTDEAVLLVAGLAKYWSMSGEWFDGAARVERLRTPSTPSLRGHVETVRSRIALATGDYPAARLHAGASAPLWREAGDRDREAQALLIVGIVAEQEGSFAEATAKMEAALDIARDANNTGQQATILNNLGNVAYRVGDLARARGIYEQVRDTARALGSPALEMMAVANIGSASWALGEYDAATANTEKALKLAESIGDRNSAGRWMANLGLIAAAQGRFEEAHVTLSEALAVARELGDRSEEAAALGNLGSVAADMGDVSTARTHHEAAVAVARDIGNRREEARGLSNLGVVALAEGDAAGALRTYAEAKSLAAELGDQAQVANCDLGLAATHLEFGDRGAAANSLSASIAAESLTGTSVVMALQLAALVDDGADAVRLLAAAYAIRQARGMALGVRQHDQAEQRRAALEESVGAAFTSAWDEGTRLDEAAAVALARRVTNRRL